MKYKDDLKDFLATYYDDYYFSGYLEEHQKEVIECWRDHDCNADKYHGMPDSEVAERASEEITDWLEREFEE